MAVVNKKKEDNSVRGVAHDQMDLLKKYLSDQLIFIVDTAAASRRRLASILVDLGATMGKITLHSNYEEAEADLRDRKPKVVICDYTLGNRSGLELLQVQRAAHAEAHDCLFILVTNNSSQSAVARAAEEDVDAFILKPYTLNSLTETLVNSSIQKLFPSPYRAKIEEGKHAMNRGQLDAAADCFAKAIELDPMPSLGYFYAGQVEFMKQALEIARGSYAKGLDYNQIHYKCLVGLFELFYSQNMHKEAYEVIRRVQKYFPANPKRLATVIRLAVMNDRYEDIEALYPVFKNLDYRDAEIVRYMCAGLVVAAQSRFKQGEPEKATELLKQAGVSCAGNTRFLRRIIEILTERKVPDLYDEFMSRFPADQLASVDFKVARFHYLLGTAPSGVAIQYAQGMIRDGVNDPGLYLELAKQFALLKKFDQAEDLLTDGMRRWPKDLARFEEALRKYKAPA